MTTYKDSEAYQELMKAVRTGDITRRHEIIRTKVNETTGAEKAFWLGLQVTGLMYNRAPGHWNMAWDMVEESLHLAPDDPEIRQMTLVSALSLSIDAERFDRFLPLVRQLGPKLSQLVDTHQVTHNLGVLHLLRRKWHQAYRWLTRSVDLHVALPESYRRNSRMSLMKTRALRCSAAIGLGKEAEALADLNFVRDLLPNYEPGYYNPIFMSLPEAELAFFQGRLTAARSALQRGLEQARALKLNLWPVNLIQCDLLAARMARAEGNLDGFRHYCEQALATCRKHDLRISEKAVRSVMAEAAPHSQHVKE